MTDRVGNPLAPDSVEFLGYSSTGYPIRVEAEDMALVRMEVESWEGRSRNQVIKVASSLFNNGTAMCYFSGMTGNYRIAVSHYDENDGSCTGKIKKNGVVVATWSWNQTPAGGTDTWRLYTTSELSLNTNDQILIQVSKNGAEAGYWDYLEFESQGMAKLSQKPLELPREYLLYENYPNPFNPTTTFSYDLPEDQFVALKVYNISGQLVETLVNGLKEAGRHSVIWHASELGTGLYLYEINAGSYHSVRKMLLIK